MLEGSRKKQNILPMPDAEEAPEANLELHLGDFSGPLDVLVFLIEKNEIDLFDIPIASLTSQYLEFLEASLELDMDVASDFLVMGANLVQVKSQMMLPKDNDTSVLSDPRDELVLRLLAYRRCKFIAAQLREREQRFAGVVFRVPEIPENLGIAAPDPSTYYADETEFSETKFRQGRTAVFERNQARFQDLSEKMKYIVSREKISIREWISQLWSMLQERPVLHFDTLFPAKESGSKRLSGFLAVLELLKQNRVRAKQERPFADILLEKQTERNPDEQ